MLHGAPPRADPGEGGRTKHILCEAVDANEDPLKIRPFIDAAISSYPSARKPEIYGDLVKQGPKLHALVSEVRQRLNTAPERAAEMDRKIVELDEAWGAGDEVWLPVQFRAGKGVRDLDKLNKLLRVTKLAISNGVSLPSLWQSGGPLYKSLTGDPPKFTREAAKSAIERLRQDLLQTHGVNSLASELASELRNLAPNAVLEDAIEPAAPNDSPQQQRSPSDAGVPDPEMSRRMPTFSMDPDISLDEDIATPHKDAPDQSPATITRSLGLTNYQDVSDVEEGEEGGDAQGQIAQHAAKRLLEQLQDDVCLTDDVLDLLLTTLERLLTKQSVTETIQVFNERQRLLQLVLSEDSRRLALSDLQLETLSAARVLRPTLEPPQRSARDIFTKSIIRKAAARSSKTSPIQLACPLEPPLEMDDEHEPIDMVTSDLHPSTDDRPLASVGTNRNSFSGRESVERPVTRGQSRDILAPSLEAQVKRKTHQGQDDTHGTGNKRLCSLDSTDLPTLSDHFLRALHEKTESAVSLSVARLRDAEKALSQAEGTLQAAKNVMESAGLLLHNSGVRTARFQQWMDKAPSEDQDPDFEDAIVSATKASQAYLDQYNFRVQKRIEAAKHDLTEAAQQIERCSSVVVECKRDLQVAQSKEEDFRNIEGVVKRLIQD
ncbi:hypothetical protein N0V84_009548 [Fusarium piperis]|uniref:Uncharacterized protein n=1 Tax=Fusarium piperis TaxID=1435070 RepID=A0A9W8W664_9HYPO|nr:hypothetical protein N0V84_009548 [Fusarium piperis]